MATLSQIKVGNITYDICDANNKNILSNINSELTIINNQLDTINSNLEKVNLNNASGLNYNRFSMPSLASTSVASGSYKDASAITWNLGTNSINKPAFGVFIIQGAFVFDTADGGSWLRVQATIRNRAKSSDSWGNWDTEVHETYKNNQYKLKLENTWTPMTAISTNQQQCLSCYHQNANGNARTCSCSGYITILWSKANDDTKTFSFSNNTITYA